MTEHIDSPSSAAFSVDEETRTIRGLAVPYGKSAFSKGQAWTFSQGSLTWSDISRIKVLVGHDFSRAVGVVTELDDREDGLYFAARIAKGPAGDELLSMASEGVWDGVSVGLGQGVKARNAKGVLHAVAAPLREISVTPIPSFDDARLTSVAASANQEGTLMSETTTEVETETEGGLDFSAFTQSIQTAISDGFASLTSPEREVVSAGRPTVQVNEAAPYRFDGLQGEHDFSTDVINGLRNSDSEALSRVITFMAEAFEPTFAVEQSNVVAANPTRTRTDLYVDERRYNTPLFDALRKGGLTDNTPFRFPKFNSAANLVSDHTEGQEPTPGSLSLTDQTVNPSALSGKVEITREVWDQGGNPKVSALIWNKMVQHYYAELEAKAYALLNGATIPGAQTVTITAGAADDDLVGEIEEVIVDLNFVPGGNTFDFAASHANLYKKLASAVDGTGRKLIPQIGPANATGTSRSKYSALDVAGVTFTPVPTLGAASNNAGNSYLIDSSSVHLWHSAPQRLDFQYRVAHVDIAVWGYVATAISDMAGVRKLVFDPTV